MKKNIAFLLFSFFLSFSSYSQNNLQFNQVITYNGRLQNLGNSGVSRNHLPFHSAIKLLLSGVIRFRITSRKRSSCASAHCPSVAITGISVLPNSLKLYSTFGGTTG